MSSAPSNGLNPDQVQPARRASTELSQIDASKWNFIIALMFLAFANAWFMRNLVWMLSFSGLLAGLSGATLASKPLKAAAVVLYVCAALALFSPMDVFFRQGDGFSCQVVPIYNSAGVSRHELVSDLRRQGMRRDRDYIVETSDPRIVHKPTSALLFTYPGNRSDPGQQ